MDAAAFDELLAAWRATRDPALAELVERAGAELAPPRTPPGKTLGAQIDARVAAVRARRAGELSAWIALPFPKSIRYLERVVEELIELPDDPRVARRLGELLVERPVDTRTAGRLSARAAAAARELRPPHRELVRATSQGAYLSSAAASLSSDPIGSRRFVALPFHFELWRAPGNDFGPLDAVEHLKKWAVIPHEAGAISNDNRRPPVAA